jgi:GNAT superfamily N-acetyltransferase
LIDGCAKLGLRIEPYYLMAEGLSLGTFSGRAEDFAEYEFRFLKERDMEALAALPGRTPSEAELIQRLQEGKCCFGVFYQGEVVAFTWWNLTECLFESYPVFALQAHEAYVFDTYTVEAYRGNGIAPYLRYRCHYELVQLGRKYCYSITVVLNQPALRFKQKLHVQIIQLNVLIEILRRWRWHFTLKVYPFRWPETKGTTSFASDQRLNLS